MSKCISYTSNFPHQIRLICHAHLQSHSDANTLHRVAAQHSNDDDNGIDVENDDDAKLLTGFPTHNLRKQINKVIHSDMNSLLCFFPSLWFGLAKSQRLRPLSDVRKNGKWRMYKYQVHCILEHVDVCNLRFFSTDVKIDT